MVRVDTITFARRLRDSGVPADQAEAHAMAVYDYVQEFATKADLDQLRRDLEGAIERNTYKVIMAIGSLVVVGIGALAALMKSGG